MNDNIMEDEEMEAEVRQLFSGMQSRVIRTIDSTLPVLSKDTRDALAIKVTNEIRNYLSEAFDK